jgi:two-component sensor histidine kinase
MPPAARQRTGAAGKVQGRITYRIDGGLKAPKRARDALALTVGASMPDDSLRELELLLSEVVTNSVMHGECGQGDQIEVAIAWDLGRIRLEVYDDGPGFRLSEPDPDRPGGWGLHLVELMSERWGIERGNRTLVWLEYSLPSFAGAFAAAPRRAVS